MAHGATQFVGVAESGDGFFGGDGASVVVEFDAAAVVFEGFAGFVFGPGSFAGAEPPGTIHHVDAGSDV